MIDQVISALKLSLAECKQYEDPREYVYELNQVLNRYKTNLFKMMEEKDRFLQDPKEFIQMRICASWVTRRGTLSRVGRCSSILKETSPVLLHINGFIPVQGERRNKEATFAKAVRIDDVVDLVRITQIKTDHFDFDYKQDHPAYTEADVMEQHLGLRYCNLSMYHQRNNQTHDLLEFSLQLNGMVFYSVVKNHELAMSKMMAVKGGVNLPRNKYPKSQPVALIDENPISVREKFTARAEEVIAEVEEVITEIHEATPLDMMKVIIAARTKGKPAPRRGL